MMTYFSQFLSLIRNTLFKWITIYGVNYLIQLVTLIHYLGNYFDLFYVLMLH